MSLLNSWFRNGVEVKVEPEHIYGSERGSSYRCPLALAIWPHLPKSVRVRVQSHHIEIDGKYHVTLPYNAQKRVSTFDRSGKMEPFSFRVRLPHELAALWVKTASLVD